MDTQAPTHLGPDVGARVELVQVCGSALGRTATEHKNDFVNGNHFVEAARAWRLAALGLHD